MSNRDAYTSESGLNERSMLIKRARTVLAEIAQQTTIYQSKHNVGIVLTPHSALDFTRKLSEIGSNLKSFIRISMDEIYVSGMKHVLRDITAILVISKDDPSYLFESAVFSHDPRVLSANSDSEQSECFGLDMETLQFFQSFPVSSSYAQSERQLEFETKASKFLRRAVKQSDGSTTANRTCKSRNTREALSMEEACWQRYAVKFLMYLKTILRMLNGSVLAAEYQKTADDLKVMRLEILETDEEIELPHAKFFVAPVIEYELYVRHRGPKELRD